MKHNQFPTSPDREPTQHDLINEKTRQLMTVFKDRHNVDPKFDPENPYEVYNETVLETVETPSFKGIVMHNVYYDTGVNPEADTGPRQKLVVAGVRGENIVNFTTDGFAVERLSGPYADDILAAMDASLDTLSSPEEK